MLACTWRELWGLHEELFDRSLFKSESTRVDKLMQVLRTISLVTHHFYSKKRKFRTQKAILRLTTLIFYHSQLLRYFHSLTNQSNRHLWPPGNEAENSLYGNYLHQLEAHVPLLARRYPLYFLINEAMEGSWKEDRHTEIYLSNHKDNLIENILIRNWMVLINILK